MDVGDHISNSNPKETELQDPGARRRMWQFIVASTERQDRSDRPETAISTVLTTHSMEECEALCSRIAILHQGKLLCLGSPSQLKSTYSSGFILEVAPLLLSFQEATIRLGNPKIGGNGLLACWNCHPCSLNVPGRKKPL